MLDTKKSLVCEFQLYEILEQAKLTCGVRNLITCCFVGKGLTGKQPERTL